MAPTAQILEFLSPSPCEASWADLTVLDKIFDHLTDVRDIAACACVCKTWEAEAARDHRWKGAWAKQVSDQGLWRWAKAEGGFREQLRANAVVRKGMSFSHQFPIYGLFVTNLLYQLPTDTPQGQLSI